MRNMKPKKIFCQKYKPDSITQGKASVIENVNKANQIFVLEIAKFDNGDEYVIYKVRL